MEILLGNIEYVQKKFWHFLGWTAETEQFIKKVSKQNTLTSKCFCKYLIISFLVK